MDERLVNRVRYMFFYYVLAYWLYYFTFGAVLFFMDRSTPHYQFWALAAVPLPFLIIGAIIKIKEIHIWTIALVLSVFMLILPPIGTIMGAAIIFTLMKREVREYYF